MKKIVLIILAIFFMSAPALVIYSSMKNSALTMLHESEKQLIHRMQNELQRQDILINPVTEIYRKLFMALRRTRSDAFLARDENEVNNELLAFVKDLMQEVTSMWFGGESSFIYRQNGRDLCLTMRNGKTVSESILEDFIVQLRYYQMNRNTPEKRATAENAINDLARHRLKMYFDIEVLAEDGDGDKIERTIIREHGSYRLLLMLRLRAAFLMNFLADLSLIDTNARARQKIEAWQHEDMGLAFVNPNHRIIKASAFFKDRQQLLTSVSNLMKVNGNRGFIHHQQNYLLLASDYDPKKPYRVIIAAKAPLNARQPRMLLLIIVFALTGCCFFKIIVENIIFGRGRDISVMMFILAIFVIVTMLPFLSSAYLANEYVAANFKKEKNRAIEELAEDLVELDVKTLANFRFAVNYAKSLNSTEKLAAFVGLPESTSINELILNAARKMHEIYGRPAFTNIWVYDESQPFFSIIYDRDQKRYRFTTGGNAVAEEYFIKRYKSYLEKDDPEKRRQNQGKPGQNIEFDELKAELLDSFFLNMFGAKSYYKIREDFGSLVWQESFMDTNALLTIPMTRNDKAKYIITWVFDSAGIRDQFPEKDLRTDQHSPLFTLFGNDQYIGARPKALNLLSRDFPELVELGNQALVTGSRLFMQNYQASGTPVFEVRPARYSDFIICGSRITRDIESITGELIAEAVRYLGWIAVGGIVLALLTSLYFTIPIRQLTLATRQIAEANYAIRLTPSHPDEFAIAADAFNKMATGLQQGELLSSFVSDSVKELTEREELTSTDIARNTRATVLFSSIRDFHSIQQRHNPQKIFEILQAHLSAAVAAVEQYGGEIDKMIEDKVMIVFENRQQNEHKQVDAAIATAIAIKNAIQKDYSLQTASGITSGEVVSGVMGAGNVRLSKTVVGDTVNLAARLAAVAANLPDGGIVASGSTVEKMSDDYLCEKLPISRVKGKTHTVEAFSVSRKTV
ncbi:MAG: hypothetical protein GQF41_0268 [Candidatus Rifleibacterium amylolyticum]|nr:MAG: hypothetical protein GQF41_0268 [Candidatus Rifleibacterium amylolyticum]